MRIAKGEYKGAFALVIETKKYRAVFLPEEGGKLSSFQKREGGREFLLQNPSPDFLHLGEDGDFVATECAGFDDMFPTVDETTVREGTRAGLLYKDHGNVCRKAFSHSIEEGCLTLSVIDEALGYTFVKKITEGADGELVIAYVVKNLLDEEFNALYTAHCLVSVPKGGVVKTQFEEGEPVDLVSDITGRLGKSGTQVPLTKELLSIPQEQGERFCHKVYFPKRVEKGRLEVVYGNDTAFRMAFDGLPCVGVWINDGIFKDVRCFGLEPATRGYDTVYKAEAHGQLHRIPPNGELKFSIALSVAAQQST